ncbi:MAG: hypothetical protein M3276_11210 [Actinomycetota bacterium]|nr:hypothetical protein [Actinomycetota bacterium]
MGSGRRVDIVDNDGIAHEVKSGYVRADRVVLGQIEKDAMLLGDQASEFDGMVWHFVAWPNGNMGADRRVLDALDDTGIPYMFHLP